MTVVVFMFRDGVILGVLLLPLFYIFKIDINNYAYVIVMLFIMSIIKSIIALRAEKDTV